MTITTTTHRDHITSAISSLKAASVAAHAAYNEAKAEGDEPAARAADNYRTLADGLSAAVDSQLKNLER